MLRFFCLWCVVAVWVGSAATADAKPLQIMLLGDSITAPDDGGSGYRLELWRRLIDANLDFDFVGTQHDLPRFGWWPRYNGVPFDPDHEGHAGWRIDHVLNGHEGKPGLAVWLDAYTPDVAIVILGREDALQNQPAEWSEREMRQVIELLRRDNDRVAILLAGPPPAVHENAANIERLVDLYTEIARRENTVQSPVRFVDLYHGLDPAEVSVGPGSSLSATGEMALAERLASALFLLDEAHLAPVRRTSIQVWGSVGVIPLGAALVFYLLARSQLRREKEASHGLTRPVGNAPLAASSAASTRRATRVTPPREDGGPISFPG
jgi:hypothetical protein